MITASRRENVGWHEVQKLIFFFKQRKEGNDLEVTVRGKEETYPTCMPSSQEVWEEKMAII